MTIEVSRMTEADINGAIDTIQQAFADDPYNNWVYPDRSKVCRLHNPSKRSEKAPHLRLNAESRCLGSTTPSQAWIQG